MNLGEIQKINTVEELEALEKAGKLKGLFDVSNDNYHAGPGTSSSNFKDFARTPAHMKAIKEGKPKKKTASMITGGHVHDRLKDQEDFDRRVVKIIGNRNLTENKLKIKDAKANGLIDINEFATDSTPGLDRIIGISDALLNHERAGPLLKGGIQEVSCYAYHPTLGFLMKCMPDSLHIEDCVCVDPKTIGESMDTIDDLERHMFKFKYHWQTKYYKFVLKLIFGDNFDFVHTFVESKPPHGVRVVKLNDASVDRAMTDLEPLFEKYAESLKTNKWPCFPTAMEDIALPHYAWAE